MWLLGPSVWLLGPSVWLSGPKVWLSGPKVWLSGPRVCVSGAVGEEHADTPRAIETRIEVTRSRALLIEDSPSQLEG